MDDEAAIQRVLDGDLEAFAVLVDRYRRAVFAVTRHLLPDATEREDVAQEAFLEAFRALDRFDPGRAQFATWLLTIARNRAINARRRASHRSRAAPPPRPVPPAADDGDARERLEIALERLPAPQRLALVLAGAHGLTYEQIAALEGVAVGTVKSRIGRARAALRSMLHPDMEQTT